MTLKQLTDTDRIVFLKKFAEELMINVIKEQEKEKIIKIEKLRQRFVQPKPLPENTFEKIIKSPIFKDVRELKEREKIRGQKIEQIKEIQELKKQEKFEELKKQPHTVSKNLSLIERLRKPIFHRSREPVKQIKRIAPQSTPPYSQSAPPLPPSTHSAIQSLIPPLVQPRTQKITPSPQTKKISVKEIKKIKPEIQPRPQGFALGKVEALLRDRTVQLVECPGPNKNIIIKKLNRINVTKNTLTQQEITTIINSFSKQARIPIMGGILKAAVGELIISAVISEYVGSRFIINKITPHLKIR